LDLATSLGAELTVFTVLADTTHLETGEARRAAERTARELLDADLDRVRARAASAGVTLREATKDGGDPAELISHFAEEHGFDLIVIGSHGRDHITHVGLGRTLERLARDPKCNILVAAERPRD
jgi:nucleotide-binding universal stress UspA family protein